MNVVRLMVVCWIAISVSCTRTEKISANSRAAVVRSATLDKIRTLDSTLAQLDAAATALANAPHETAAHTQLQKTYHAARTAYKQAECLIAYYTPTSAKELNGAPIDEYEEGTVVPATGFQVLEELLFPAVQTSETTAIRFNTSTMKSVAVRVRQVMTAQEFTDAHVFDALRQHTNRTLTLGLAGFDSAVLQTAVADVAIAFRELRDILAVYENDMPTELRNNLRTAFETALNALNVNALNTLQRKNSFETFDRASFLVQHALPLARLVWQTREQLHIPTLGDVNVLRAGAATVYDSAAFNPLFFAPAFAREAANDEINDEMRERIALGKRLFYEPALSGGGNRTCASCHQPDRAFTDGVAKSKAIMAGKHIARNAPTILYAALQRGQFYDVRVTYLEDQATDVIQNPDEMHGSLDEAARLLSEREEYRVHFARAFHEKKSINKKSNEKNSDEKKSGEKTFNEPRVAISAEKIRMALAAFERSLARFDSPFDRYTRGDTSAMTAEQRRGFTVFMGKAKCGTCHFAPLFNGTVPPTYEKTEWEIIGVPNKAHDIFSKGMSAHRTHTNTLTIDGDIGRERVERVAAHRYAFKTPTLRNVALTAPYMHNGAYQTLEQVMDFYNRGGGKGIGLAGSALDSQTLSDEPLHLSPNEIRAVIAFLHALTDTPNPNTAQE